MKNNIIAFCVATAALCSTRSYAVTVPDQYSPYSDLGAKNDNSYNSTEPVNSNTVQTYQWNFHAGNLLGNWSFEEDQSFWHQGVGANLRAAGGYSGKYCAAVCGTSSWYGRPVVINAVVSDAVTLKANQSYRLSLMYYGNARLHLSPKMVLSTLRGEIIQTEYGTEYSPSSVWKKYTWIISPHDSDYRVSLTLASGEVEQNTNLFLDNVMLEELNLNDTVNADDYYEKGTVSDPLGMEYHTFEKSNNNESYLINAKGYDGDLRQDTSYMPYFASEPTGVPTDRQNYVWNANYKFGAGSAPFSRTIYADSNSLGRPQIEHTASGEVWNTGHHYVSGWTYTDFLPVSANEMPSSIENWTTGSGEMKYKAEWKRDQDSNYTIAWKDQRSQVHLTANLINRNGSNSPQQWTWAFCEYVYYPNGALKYKITPLDYGSTESPLSRIVSYDGSGRVIAVKSPDEGIVKYWYDMAGNLRFKQSANQVSDNIYTYLAYDNDRRLISEGTAVIPQGSDMQSLANTAGSETSYLNHEMRGWIYDNIDNWKDRNLIDLSKVVGKTDWGINGAGRLVAQYNRNDHIRSTVAGDTSLVSRLVVDLYSYDDQGRIKNIGKYIGPQNDVYANRYDLEYRYDSLGRLSEKIFDKNMDRMTLAKDFRNADMWYKYLYDDRNRVDLIKDENTGKMFEAFAYDNQRSVLTRVALPSVNGRTEYDYSYDLHNNISKMIVQNPQRRVLFEEALGYNDPVLKASQFSTKTFQSYSGLITQSVRAFTPPTSDDATSIVRAHQYQYDAGGRLLSDALAVPDNRVGYFNDSIIAAANYITSDSLTESFVYDVNGRVENRKRGVVDVGASYYYGSGTNRLDHVTNIVSNRNRNASSAGNFEYDASGNMIYDHSVRKWMNYDADGNVSIIGYNDSSPSSTGGDGGMYMFPYYDADGSMVTLTTSINKANIRGVMTRNHYVNIGGQVQKEIREIWDAYNDSITGTSSITNILGAESVIGRKLMNGNEQFYIKDHLGSVVMVIDSTGNPAGSYDYLAYGTQDVLHAASPENTEEWTGKHYYEGPNLYSFGRRWYDPDLGLWISPDPMHQHYSPYAYAENPISSVDKNGLGDGEEDEDEDCDDDCGDGGGDQDEIAAAGYGNYGDITTSKYLAIDNQDFNSGSKTNGVYLLGNVETISTDDENSDVLASPLDNYYHNSYLNNDFSYREGFSYPVASSSGLSGNGTEPDQAGNNYDMYLSATGSVMSAAGTILSMASVFNVQNLFYKTKSGGLSFVKQYSEMASEYSGPLTKAMNASMSEFINGAGKSIGIIGAGVSYIQGYNAKTDAERYDDYTVASVNLAAVFIGGVPGLAISVGVTALQLSMAHDGINVARIEYEDVPSFLNLNKPSVDMLRNK